MVRRSILQKALAWLVEPLTAQLSFTLGELTGLVKRAEAAIEALEGEHAKVWERAEEGQKAHRLASQAESRTRRIIRDAIGDPLPPGEDGEQDGDEVPLPEPGGQAAGLDGHPMARTTDPFRPPS